MYNAAREKAISKEFDVTEVLIQVDVSENYKCMYQDEIQSAHWDQSQVSIVTAAYLVRWQNPFISISL